MMPRRILSTARRTAPLALGVVLLAGGSASAQSVPGSTTVPGPVPTTAPSTTSTSLPTGPGHIGDRVWLDLNRDRDQDANEPGIPGVRLELWTGGAAVASATTDDEGRYSFDHLPAGTFEVRIVGGLPAGVSVTSDPWGIGAQSAVVVLGGASGVDAMSTDAIDFGFAGPGAVCSIVWTDDNGDGDHDSAESTVSRAGVVALGPNGITTSVVTGSDGTFCVEGLPLGEWRFAAMEGSSTPLVVTLTAAVPQVKIEGVAVQRPSTLAFTGGTIAGMVGVGLGSITAGAGLLRRRRSRA